MIQKMARKCPGWGLVAIVVLILAGCGGDDKGQQGAQNQQNQAPPRKAQVLKIDPRDLRLDKQYPAMVRSDLAVNVVARVSGILEEQHYTPGEMVEKGQKLFTIEQAPYRAVVEQRKADLQSARANYSQAQRDYGRYKKLYEQGSVSQQQRDEALNTLETTRAAVAQAKAALDSAQIDLDYTTVESPVAGMASLKEVNLGNLVQPQDLLATVTPLDPLEVRFSLPQEDAFTLRKQRQMVGVPKVVAQMNAPAVAGAASEPLTGKLDFLGSRVDEDTSTVQARATFDNPDQLFMPGQFVRVKLQNLMRFGVLAVPEVAVTEGLKGPQVFVLDQDNTVQSRFVSTGEQAGAWMIITDGLKAGDRVVVSAIGSISAGDKIDPQPFDGNPAYVPENKASNDDGAKADNKANGIANGDSGSDNATAKGNDGASG